MKIAISCKGPSIDDSFDSHFGRASYFQIFEDNKWHSFDNRENANAAQGAGISTAQSIIDMGVDVIITGSLGPKASRVIADSDIQVFLSDLPSIKENLLQFAPKLGLSITPETMEAKK